METPLKKIKDKKYNNTPEYNKKYYQKHKTEILGVLTAKCVCELCNRTVSRNRLRLHKTTALCMNNRTESSKESLIDQIETLTQELNQLKAPSA
jgi:hypothetical protein